MNTDFIWEGKKLLVNVNGNLTSETAPLLEKQLKDVIFDAKKIVFDLSKMAYVSSAGLRVLLWAHKAMLDKDGMVLKGVNEVVKEIFSITGFLGIFNIE